VRELLAQLGDNLALGLGRHGALHRSARSRRAAVGGAISAGHPATVARKGRCLDRRGSAHQRRWRFVPCLGVLAVVPGAHRPDPIRWIKPGFATDGHGARHTLS
jgi:hypothetical protein